VSGSLIRQELVLIPARGLNQYSVSRFEHYARTVEPPSITPPGHLAGTEDGDIAAILALHRKKAGSATDHLAPLLTGSRR
jgi:hypothetical protein